MRHLADPVRVALGEKEAQPVSGPLGLPGLAHAVVWFMPWPKGAPTAPEFLPEKGGPTPGDFKEDKEILFEVLRRFAETPPDKEFAPNPMFGRLSCRGWGRLLWRHADHHLR